MRMKKSFGGMVFDVINILLLVLLSICIVFPLMVVFTQSVTPRVALGGSSYSLIPFAFNWSAYKYLLLDSQLILRGFGNSMFFVIVGSALSLLTTAMLAYPLSRKYLPYRTFLTYFIYLATLIGSGLIPTYLIVRFLNLMGTMWSIIIPSLIGTWNVLLMRNFFQEIPDSLEEAALIDGASDVTVLFRIIMPISLPALATIGLFYAVGYWNTWFTPALYLSNKSQWPLQLIVRQMVVNVDANSSDVAKDKLDRVLKAMPPESVRSAAVFITTLPMLLFYPFAQKYFVKGLVVGSIKG